MAWLTGWSYRQSVTLDSNGIGLSGNLTDGSISVHVPSSNTNFWSHVKSDGTDVRFTSDDGSTLLKFEIESFDNTGDDAWYHIKIPTITSATDTVLYLYYGNASATSGEDIPNTWDANFKAVLHLNQDKAAGAYDDSTSGGNDGTATGTSDIAGKIDRGRDFNGSSDRINLANETNFDFERTDSFTLEAWVKNDTFAAPGVDSIIGKTDSAWKGFLLFTNTTPKVRFWIVSSTVNDILIEGSTTLSTATDYHIVATYDGSSTAAGAKIYVNGALETPTVVNDRLTTSILQNISVEIGGASQVDANRHWDGAIDEVTISNTNRSADWVKIRYQSGLGTWLTFGAEERIIPIPKTDFNFTGKVPGVYNSGNDKTIAVPKVNFNFTGKVPTVSVLSSIVVPIPKATFNFTRFAPTIRTQDKGIQVPKVNFNFTGKVPTVSMTGHRLVAVPKATFNFTGKVPSILLTNSEEEISWGIFDTSGDPITGATVTIKIRFRDSGHILDWSDNTFKLGGGSSPTANMTEMDAANFQGYYKKVITIGAWADGWYIAATTYAGTPKQNGSIEFLVKGGLMVDSYNSANLDVAVSSRPTLSEMLAGGVAKESTAQSILTESQSHPTLAEMQGVLAQQTNVNSLTTAINSLNQDVYSKIYVEPGGNQIKVYSATGALLRTIPLNTPAIKNAKNPVRVV